VIAGHNIIYEFKGGIMYRITIEEYQEGQGWSTVVKTTDKKYWLNFINLTKFASCANALSTF